MSTTIWAYASLEHLPYGRVVTDKRGVTAIHQAKDRWLAQLTDATITTVPTQLLALPVTLRLARKEPPP